MNKLQFMLTVLLTGSALILSAGTAAAAQPNVVIIISDDQRWDKITPEFMPNVYQRFVQNGIAFNNAFVPTSLCCPSRATILSGRYAHSTGVWSNGGAYGGFGAFDDKHTLAVDFQQGGYRTAMIGKYLNFYPINATNKYVPPGWDKWFAVNTGAFYNYGVVSTGGVFLKYGALPQDYISRVLSTEAINFVTDPLATKPFFLYYSFTAPHIPSLPDPLDDTRFAGRTNSVSHDDMLESAFGMDREIGNLLNVLPPHTIVVFMSDNGYLWGETKGALGPLEGKLWPYNESIRVPLYMISLDGSLPQPTAGINDLVLNVDLRTTLTHLAGIAPITRTEGLDWFSPSYTARTVFPLELYKTGGTPTYCGAREAQFMYVRFFGKSGPRSYTEELYNDPAETVNLIGNPAFQADYDRLKSEAMRLCNPAPPGYKW